MDIKYIKLKNGTEFISEIKQDGDTSLTLDMPLQIIITGFDQKGQPQIQLIPFALFTDEKKMEIPKSEFLLDPMAPTSTMIEHYTKITKKASIVTPEKPGIII